MFSFLIKIFIKKEPTIAQLTTAHTLATRVFIKMYRHRPEEAEELAYRQIRNWLEEDKFEDALKGLWKNKLIA